MMERAEELYLNNDLSQLRSEFMDEVLQTLAEEAVGSEATKEDEGNFEVQAVEAPAVEAPPPST